LHYAARLGDVEVSAMLLHEGADIDAQKDVWQIFAKKGSLFPFCLSSLSHFELIGFEFLLCVAGLVDCFAFGSFQSISRVRCFSSDQRC
jgi:hypothetical protein